jgi:NAD(P)H dehydrogenase (quinone)
MAPKIAIVYYSTWGHMATMSKAVQKGVEAKGGQVDVFQVGETLPEQVLTMLHAAPKDTSVPEITADKIKEYDGILMGVPTRYGNMPAQWKTFWDGCVMLWAQGALYGKFAGVFVSTAQMGGGQEATVQAMLSTIAHMGMVWVPLGYPPGEGNTIQSNVDEVRGGSPWGAGTFAKGDGSRQPTANELRLAEIQGEKFAELLAKHHS